MVVCCALQPVVACFGDDGTYRGVQTNDVSRDAGDDIIEFRGADTRLCISAGRGIEVRSHLYVAIAKGYAVGAMKGKKNERE